MHIFIKKKKLILDKYRIKCAIGKRGIGNKKREGDKITPKGKFKIKTILYRKDRVSHFKSKIRKLSIKRDMGWCDESSNKKYNREIYFPFKYSAEKLYRRDRIYDIFINIKYNYSPIIKEKGSAIFLHLSNKKYKPTSGCVTILKKDFLKKKIFVLKVIQITQNF